MTEEQKQRWREYFESVCRQAQEAIRRALDRVDDMLLEYPDARYIVGQLGQAAQAIGVAAGIAGDLTVEERKTSLEEKATETV